MSDIVYNMNLWQSNLLVRSLELQAKFDVSSSTICTYMASLFGLVTIIVRAEELGHAITIHSSRPVEQEKGLEEMPPIFCD